MKCEKCKTELGFDAYVHFDSEGKHYLCRKCLIDKIEKNKGETPITKHLKEL